MARSGAKARPGGKASPSLKDRLAGAAYALGWSAVCRMPESWAAAAFKFMADIAWRRQGPRVRVLEGNLRRVLGAAATGKELRAVSRDFTCGNRFCTRVIASGVEGESSRSPSIDVRVGMYEAAPPGSGHRDRTLPRERSWPATRLP